MVCWWVTDSYFNNKQIQNGDIELITTVYGSSGTFGLGVRYKYLGNYKCTGRRSNFHSEPTPIHGIDHKSDLNYSYLRSHFSLLPRAAAKKLIYC